MIHLSELSVTRHGRTRYRLITPGYTEALTTLQGVASLLAADGTNDLGEAERNARHLLGNHGAQWDVRAFLRLAFACGLLFRDPAHYTPVFAATPMVRSLEKLNFRSLSVLDICPTDRCNLRCSYCTLWKNSSRLPLHVIQRCISEARAFGVNTVNIVGGEPTLFPALTRDIVSQCADLGIERVTVSTNGLRLDEHIATMWRAAGLRVLQISVDYMHGGGKSFSACGRMVRLACNIFDEVIVGFVYHGQSIGQHLLPLERALRHLPVRLDLKYAIPHEGSHCSIDALQIRAFCRSVGSRPRTHRLLTGPNLGGRNIIFCGAGSCHAFVCADGNIKACPYLREAEGNLHEKSFADIWTSGRWNRYCRPKAVRDTACQVCDLRRWCLAGCLAKYRSRKLNCVRLRGRRRPNSRR